MFDMNEAAKKIKQARIYKNMTQMGLAEAMDVSYQAVSSWERGNSMPDISKLEKLCDVLEISVTELLGVESQSAATVNRVLQNDQALLSADELVDIAPILTPEQVKQKTTQAKEKKMMNLSAIAELIPYLNDDDVEELVMEAAQEDMHGFYDIVSVISRETAERLAQRLETSKMEDQDIELLFLSLSEESRQKFVYRCAETGDYQHMEDLASALRKHQLIELAEYLCENRNTEALNRIACHLPHESVKKVAKVLMETVIPEEPDELERIAMMARWMDKKELDSIVQQQMDKDNLKNISMVFQYLSPEMKSRVIKKLMKDENIDVLRSILGYFLPWDVLRTVTQKLMVDCTVAAIAEDIAPYI